MGAVKSVISEKFGSITVSPLSEIVLLSEKAITKDHALEEVRHLASRGEVYHIASEGEVLTLIGISEEVLKKASPSQGGILINEVNSEGRPMAVGADSLGPFFMRDLHSNATGYVVLLKGPDRGFTDTKRQS